MLGVGCWVLSAECWVLGGWVLGIGCWVLSTGHWVLGVGCWVLGAEYQMLGARCWVLGAACPLMLQTQACVTQSTFVPECGRKIGVWAWQEAPCYHFLYRNTLGEGFK